MSPPERSLCSRSGADSSSRLETTSGKSCPALSSLSRRVFGTLSAPWKTGRSCSLSVGLAELPPLRRSILGQHAYRSRSSLLIDQLLRGSDISETGSAEAVSVNRSGALGLMAATGRLQRGDTTDAAGTGRL